MVVVFRQRIRRCSPCVLAVIVAREAAERGYVLAVLALVSLPVAVLTSLAASPNALEQAYKLLAGGVEGGGSCSYYVVVNITSSGAGGWVEALAGISAAGGGGARAVLGQSVAWKLGVREGGSVNVCLGSSGCVEAVAEVDGEGYRVELYLPRSVFDEWRASSQQLCLHSSGRGLASGMGFVSVTVLFLSLLYAPTAALSCRILLDTVGPCIRALRVAGAVEASRNALVLTGSVAVLVHAFYGVALGVVAFHAALTLTPLLGLPPLPARPLPPLWEILVLVLVPSIATSAYCLAVIGGKTWE